MVVAVAVAVAFEVSALLANRQFIVCGHEPFLCGWSVATRRADRSKLALTGGKVIVAMGAGIDSNRA